jgi:hypothetical protein
LQVIIDLIPCCSKIIAFLSSQKNHDNGSSSEHNQSSEGFTAFLTTTDSNANSNNAASSENSFADASSARGESLGDKSDGDSSMVVVAHSKRKH